MTREFFKIREALPDLGIGLGLRREILEETLESSADIDWVEITPEGFLGCYGKSVRRLERAAAVYKIISHGVNLSLGSTDELNPEYLRQLKELLDMFEVPWWSDHVSFASFDQRYVNNLLPLPRTRATVDLFVKRIRQAQDYIERPILIENISFYMPNPPGTVMSEARFISELLEQADCGMLLDVNNVYVNSVNHGFDPFEFILQLPLERVVQVHVAGHNYHENTIIDTHSEAVCEPVYDLLEFVLRRVRPKGVMLERDDNYPEFSEILSEVKRIRKIFEECCDTGDGQKTEPHEQLSLGEVKLQVGEERDVVLADVERIFAKVVLDRIERPQILDQAEAGSPDAGGFDARHAEQLDLYGRITDAGALATMQSIFPGTRKLLGEEYWTWSVAEYYHREPPARYVLVHVGEGYPAFLKSIEERLPNQIAVEMAEFEWARMSLVESPIEWRTDLTPPSFNPKTLTSYRPVLNPSLAVRSYSYDVADVFDYLQEQEEVSEVEVGAPSKIAFLRMPEDQEVMVFEVNARMDVLLTEIGKCSSYSNLMSRLLKKDGATDPVRQIAGYMEELNSLYQWNLIAGDAVVPVPAVVK
jgi:uncharacterized protein